MDKEVKKKLWKRYKEFQHESVDFSPVQDSIPFSNETREIKREFEEIFGGEDDKKNIPSQ